MTVCDVLRDGAHSNGTIVVVRGTVRNSGDAQRPDFNEVLATCDGISRTILIDSPDAQFLAAPPKGYKPNAGSVRGKERVMARAAGSVKDFV